MDSMKHQFEIGFTDYMPWVDDDLTRSIKAGNHDCTICGELLTPATVSIVGRAVLEHEMVMFGVCAECHRKAGGFKQASRLAGKAFCDTCLSGVERIWDPDDIHPIAGHA